MKVDFDVSGWSQTRAYKKFDVIFFSGDPVTGCNPFESGYYYATADNDATTNESLAPTGSNTKWTRSFPSTPSYNSSVSFNAENSKNVFGDGYYTLLPTSHNNLKVKYNLNFQGRTSKEAKAILHFLGHRFEEAYTGANSGTIGAHLNGHTEYQGDVVLTGFNFTPFAPYNQSGKYYCEEFDHNQAFTNVHNINAIFDKSEDSLTNWKNKEINLDNTLGFWAEGVTYNKYDIVYFSGHNVSNFSGFYYYTGTEPADATTANGPTGDSTLWTNDTFYFNPSSFSIPQRPRILKSELNRNYVERWNDGINSNLLNINLQFEGKSEHEAKAISHFLINKKGYESFKFSPPEPYNQGNKIFVCQSWFDNFVFSDNRSLSANFEEMPLDLNKAPRNFRTYILDDGGRIIAPYEKQIGTDDSVFKVDYGIFMTGFKSGTGMYLYNSGDQKIVSTLSLSGEHARSGVYKFKENTDSRFKLNSNVSAIFELGQKESGFFEIEFATTGKSGAQNSWFTDDLPTDGYFYYFSGHGGASYIGPHERPSQLTITSTDQYNFADPSGTLKIDLTGNAEALPPGPIASFDVQANNDDILLTGQWTYSKPLTATGILLEVSGVAKNASLPAGETATGVLIDEPTGTTVFSYPCVPGQAHYFRIRTQNIDLIGGNVNGGNLRKVESTEFVHANATITKTSLTVNVNNQTAESFAEKNFGFRNVNLKTIAQNEINRLNNINPNITIDVFSKIEFLFSDGMHIFSADNSLPALDTGSKFTNSYGAGLDPVPIELYIPKSTQIIGAGGKGANAASVRTHSVDGISRIECPVAFKVNSAQESILNEHQVKLGSLPELAGIGPVATQYLDEKMDGLYVVGNAPNNGEDGGTAFKIDASYASASIKLDCRGFIGGGGGGGGAGGTRTANIYGTMLPSVFKSQDPYTKETTLHTRTLEDMYLPFQTKNARARGRTEPQPYLQTDPVPENVANESPSKDNNTQYYYEVRPGGGGGGGAGFTLSTTEGGDAGKVKPSPAQGGAGCPPFVSALRRWGDNSFQGLNNSQDGDTANLSFPINSGTMSDLMVKGGLGARSRVVDYPNEIGAYYMQDPSGLLFYKPSAYIGLAQEGGKGGHGGGFGQDGGNGSHPIQYHIKRYVTTSTQGFPEPRNFGFGGTGGLCIDTNGAIIDFHPKNNIPRSGQDDRDRINAKNSELYRNEIGFGAYLTPKFTSATTIDTNSGQNRVVGLISGLRSNGSDKIDFTTLNKSTPNQSNATNSSYPAWKAFNQEIDGDFDNYVYFDQDRFPYYLIYDFGENNEQLAEAYSITAAAASPSYYANGTEAIFGEVYAPVSWTLFGYNGDPDNLTEDKNMTLLDQQSLVIHCMGHNGAAINATKGPQQIWDIDGVERPLTDESGNPVTALLTADGDKHTSTVSVPGGSFKQVIPEENRASFRYYILKITLSEHEMLRELFDRITRKDTDAIDKVKIGDFGLYGKNESYAGFIKIPTS